MLEDLILDQVLSDLFRGVMTLEDVDMNDPIEYQAAQTYVGDCLANFRFHRELMERQKEAIDYDLDSLSEDERKFIKQVNSFDSKLLAGLLNE